MQKISGMKERYEKDKKKYEDIIERLQQQINEMNISNEKSNVKQDNNLNEKNIVESKEINQKQNNSIIGKMNLVEFEEENLMDTETVYVPNSIVNRYDSIFDGNDNWHEIMKFEVEEEGWKAVNELIQEGINKEYIDYELKRAGYSSIEEMKNDTSATYGWIVYLMEQEKKGNSKQILENSICYDGIILMDIEDLNYKLIAQKQKKEGKNYYKIFSNRAIQDYEVFKGDIKSYLVKCGNWNYTWKYICENEGACKINDTAKGIGIKGFKTILNMKNIKYKNRKNLLLFSLKMMNDINKFKQKYKNMEEYIRENKINEQDYSSRNYMETYKKLGKEFNSEVWSYVIQKEKFIGINETDIPALYWINEENRSQIENYSENITKDCSTYIEREDELEFIQAFEKLLSRQQKDKNIEDNEIEI